MERAGAAQDRHFAPGVQHVRREPQIAFRRKVSGLCPDIGRMVRPVPLRPLPPRNLLLLQVRRERDVRHLPIAQRRAAGEIRQVLDVLGAHHPLVVDRYILEQLVQLDILLRQHMLRRHSRLVLNKGNGV